MSENKLLQNRFIAALFAGLISAFAFAPFDFFIASIVSISSFFLLLEKKSNDAKSSFYIGLCYGFGYFLAGIYWIAISLLVDAQKFAWLIPFCLTIIPAVLALYFALLSVVYKKICVKFNVKFTYEKILVFAILWIIFEALRSILFTGFAWNLIGYSLMFSSFAIQSASIFGIYGLSFFAVLFSLTPVAFFDKSKSGKIFLAIVFAVFVANISFGFYRIKNTELKVSSQQIRLVQGNIKQDLKWNPLKKYQNFLKHIDISNAQNKDNIKAVIWSETATPYPIGENKELIAKLNEAIPDDGFLITGALRINFDRYGYVSEAYNSVFAIEKTGEMQHYDKHHLVPFGEYIPFEKMLPFLQKITGGGVGFSEGEGPKTLEMKGLKFSPLICYEVIFSNKIIDRQNRPDLLVNVTNDAWFGVSSGPYQHYNMTKMRAVEYGISLARVANTGITAYIDPLGRVQKQIALNDEGFIDVNLVEKTPETIFSHFKYFALLLLLAVIALFLIISIKHHKNEVFSKI